MPALPIADLWAMTTRRQTWIHPNAYALVARALYSSEDRALDALEREVADLRDATNIERSGILDNDGDVG